MIYIIICIILIVIFSAIIIQFSRNRNALIFFILIIGAMFCGMISGYKIPDILNLIKRGAAETTSALGLIVITGNIYAKLLYSTGVFNVLAGLASRIGKKKYSSLAVGIFGGIVSIPVTCETGYMMYSPFGLSAAKKSGVQPAVYAVSLSCGMYITHALVLPTPGPLTAGGIMNVNFFLLFALGLAVSVPCIIAANYFSCRFAARHELEILPEYTEPVIKSFDTKTSLTVVLIPVFLIAARGIAGFPEHPFGNGFVYRIIYFSGEPFVAILLSSLILVVFAKKMKIQHGTAGIVETAFMQSAQIILIAAAAGAFAAVFRTTGVIGIIPVSVPHWMGLLIPFMAGIIFKLLHGSSTVAMISASSVAFASVYSMKICPELAVLSAGAGAMIISHANDPYFWIVSRFSGLSVLSTYRLFSLASFVCGLVAIIIVLLLGSIF